MGRRTVCVTCLVWLAAWALSAGAATIDESGVGPLADVARLGGGKTARVSSNDPSTGNQDWTPIEPGEMKAIFDESGPGCIRHLWMTLKAKKEIGKPDYHLRQIVIRMFWDGETNPSVEAPLGDFFGLGHAEYYSYTSLPMVVGVKKGMNCFLPMPFASGARIEIENQGELPIEKFYYNVDFERYDEAPGEDWGRFHAGWHRWNPTKAVDPPSQRTRFEDNIVILDAVGRGRYLGCNLSAHSLGQGWWGEGDDLIAIDGTTPTLKGTGTEDYFGCAWGFPEECDTPYFGVAYLDSEKDPEKTTAYRWHIEDPVNFSQRVRVTLEHGEGNSREDDISATAYWYQVEPHQPLDPLPAVADRLPRARVRELPAEDEEKSATRPVVVPQSQATDEDTSDAAAVELTAILAIFKYVYVPVILVVAGYYAYRRLRGTRRRGPSA